MTHFERSSRITMVLLACLGGTSPAAAQEPEPPKPPESRPAGGAEQPPSEGGRADQQPKPAVVALDDDAAKTALKTFKEGTWSKKPLVDRMLAVEQLAAGSHPLIARELNNLMLRERDKVIQVVAARSLAMQPEREAQRYLLAALNSAKLTDDEDLCVELLKGLMLTGYRDRDLRMLEGFFRKGPPRITKVVAQLFGKHKEKGAVKLLIEHLDEPAPANVDDPSNPPASYWEERWRAWKVWVEDVRAALKEITGQTFADGKQAREWLKREGKKQGF